MAPTSGPHLSGLIGKPVDRVHVCRASASHGALHSDDARPMYALTQDIRMALISQGPIGRPRQPDGTAKTGPRKVPPTKGAPSSRPPRQHRQEGNGLRGERKPSDGEKE